MRVQLDRDDSTVDIEERLETYNTEDRDIIFFSTLKKALLALGYSDFDMFAYLSRVDKEK